VQIHYTAKQGSIVAFFFAVLDREESLQCLGETKTYLSAADISAAISLAFEEIAQREGCTVNDLCDKVDARRGRMGLTGAVRVALVRYYRDRTAELQHRRRPNAIDGPVRRSGLEAWC
jgi:predicted DNA-binding ribbon-helix-helix protein